MAETTRTPHGRTIRYGITGAPILDESDMDGSFAPGVGVQPALIELVYSTAHDGHSASLTASVVGWWTRFGVLEQPERQTVTHFKNGPDGWPAWLAEEARSHGPAAPTDQAALRDLVADAIHDDLNAHRARRDQGLLGIVPRLTDAVMAVLPASDPAATKATEPASPSAGDKRLVELHHAIAPPNQPTRK